MAILIIMKFGNLKITKSDQFVNQLPQKLDTIVGEEEFSYQEVRGKDYHFQNISKTEILILDEATIAVSPDKFNTIENIKKQKLL